jgi:hypothetical protein
MYTAVSSSENRIASRAFLQVIADLRSDHLDPADIGAGPTLVSSTFFSSRSRLWR